VGGALGGASTALAAPLLFRGPFEYPLALALGCFAAPPADGRRTGRATLWGDVTWAAGIAALVVGLGAAIHLAGVLPPAVARILVLTPAAFLVLRGSAHPRRYGLATAVLLFAFYADARRELVHAARSFFGIYGIEASGPGHLAFVHGGTVHGLQDRDAARRCVPLTYYNAEGPIGQVFAARAAGARRVAVVGLGIGTLAAYARPADAWTFYEIDPAVERIARDARFFSFLRDCAPQATVIPGDARLALAHAADASADILVLDAYSSDAIPVHLVTREALALYLDKLAPGGVLAFHISNQYLDLAPVLAGLAADAALTARVQTWVPAEPVDPARGRIGSQWALLARRVDDLGPLAADPRWQPLVASTGRAPWTDDLSSVLTAVRWGG
jgi:SAM-dependent methyltransferase